MNTETKNAGPTGEDGDFDEAHELDQEMLKDPLEVEARVASLMRDTGVSREDAMMLITGNDPDDNDDE